MQNETKLETLLTTIRTLAQVSDAAYLAACKAHGADSPKAISLRDINYTWADLLRSSDGRSAKWLEAKIAEALAFHA